MAESVKTDDGTPGDDATGDDGSGRSGNFIRERIDADLEAGRHTRVVTRFPPEPNGWLHIGHAKSICLNFGIAEDYGGDCHLRFDDTNPETEDASFVEAIAADVAWLGFRWTGGIRYASDYFGFMYDYAVKLIEQGLAYVDSSSLDEIRAGRGTVYEAGTPSKDRDRPVAESLDLFARMKAGEFPDGAYVLRAKIDMASPNMLLRDPLLYRIRHAHHYRTGDAWCIYPMYDYAHCLEDAIEGVTHSLCTLEFDNNRALYDWVLDHGDWPDGRPYQTEFARLSVAHMITSKRKLLRLVNEGHVSGWDDPRMPTVAGLRRRGVRAEALRAFCDLVGVARSNNLVDLEKLEYCIRDDLNAVAPRRMAVLRPLALTVTTWPEGEVDELDAPSFPEDVGLPGSRSVPFGRRLLVERDDFDEHPAKGWHRLAPGREVRLRHGYLVTVDEVVKDAAGEVIELRCSHDPGSRGGDAPDGRRVPGTIHWVSADHAVRAEVRLYDRLFTPEAVGADEGVDLIDELNPDSLVVCADARLEPALADLPAGERVQFERLGFFVVDPERSDGLTVFNRTVGLRDSWARKAAPDRTAARRKPPRPAPTAPSVDPSHARDARRAEDAELAARFARYRDELDLAPSDADLLSGDRELSDWFESALAGPAAPAVVARWLTNELQGRLGPGGPAALPFDGPAFASLVALVEDGTVNAAGGKTLLARMVEQGGDPAGLVRELGLEQVSDEGALQADIDAVLAAHPDELRRYRDGDGKLMGFFMGALMRATGGKADPKLASKLLTRALKG